MKFVLCTLVFLFISSPKAAASSCQIPATLAYDITPSVTYTDFQGAQVADSALVPILTAEPRLMKAYVELRMATHAHVIQTGFGIIVQLMDTYGKPVGAIHHHFAKPSAFFLSTDNETIPVHYYLYGSTITGFTVHFTHGENTVDLNLVLVARQAHDPGQQQDVSETQHQEGPHEQQN
jgi:hypothetical protein